MAHPELDSAQLFVPGRASYVTSGPDDTFELHLTEASAYRADVAANNFDADFHTTALFAGGYPGVAQNWPPEHTPPVGGREADLMSMPLKWRLQADGWSAEAIADKVKSQGESNNSIGDVLISMERGLLDPNDFHTADNHGLELVAGKLHGMRFRNILIRALDLDPKRFIRTPIHDTYGTPATEFRPKESAAVALSKEYVAIGLTRYVMKDVKAGPDVIDDLREAEQRFNDIATKRSK